jgi:hypothetical protein
VRSEEVYVDAVGNYDRARTRREVSSRLASRSDIMTLIATSGHTEAFDTLNEVRLVTT